jgi:microcystin-dependent protein
MVSTFTPALQLEEPARGDYVNSWDLPANSNFTQIDNGVGGVTTLTVTTGNVVLTQAQANSAILVINGTMTGNVNIFYPPTTGGRKLCIPNVAVAGFQLSIRGNSGADTVGIFFKRNFAGIPVGFITTPSRVFWDYGGVIPGTVASWPLNIVPPGWLVCDGTLYSTTQYDLLFSIVGFSFGGSGGSFAVPDYRGYSLVGSDNMGGPAGNAGRFFNFGPNGVTGEITHVLTISELASHNHGLTDPTHAHGASQAPHSHGGVIVPGGVFALGSPGLTIQSGRTDTQQPAVTVNPAATGITIAANGGNAGHNNVQPSKTTNKYIRW